MNCPFCAGTITQKKPMFCPICGQSLDGVKLQPSTSKRTRGNGFGSVVPKPNGTYMARATICVDTGNDRSSRKEKTKSGFLTKKEALEAAIQLRKQLESKYIENGMRTVETIHENQQACLPAESSEWPCVEQLWTKFSSSAKFKALGDMRQKRYRYAYDKWSPLHMSRIDKLTVDDLQNTVNSKTTTHYPARDMRDLMSMLYKCANTTQKQLVNLALQITLPPAADAQKDTTGQAFSLPELEKFWSSYENGNLAAAYILVMSYTGMMPVELCDLSVDMIDMEKQQIVGVGRKTATRKNIPILFGKGLKPVLQLLCEHAAPDGHLIDVGERALRRRISKCLSDLSCAPLKPYNCRHTTETLLKLYKVSQYYQYVIMRHRQLNITDKYANAEQLIPQALAELDQLTHKPNASDYEQAKLKSI